MIFFTTNTVLKASAANYIVGLTPTIGPNMVKYATKKKEKAAVISGGTSM